MRGSFFFTFYFLVSLTVVLCTYPGRQSEGSSCYTAIDFLHENHAKFMNLQRRGVPETAIEVKFELLVKNLREFLGIKSRKVSSLFKCLSKKKKRKFIRKYETADGFTRVVENRGLQSHLDPTSFGDFFLGNIDFSNDHIQIRGNRFEESVNNVWESFFNTDESEEMAKDRGRKWEVFFEKWQDYLYKPSKARATDPILQQSTRYIPTVSIFYEPSRRELLIEMEKHTSSRKGIAQEVTAEFYLYECLAAAYSIKLLKVDERHALEIVEHCVMFLFQTMRVKEEEGPLMLVSGNNIPLYHSAFEHHSKGVKTSIKEKAKVPWYTVKEVWQGYLNFYLAFDNWGKTSFINWHKNRLVAAEKILFHGKIMSLIKKAAKEDRKRQDLNNARQSSWTSMCSSSAYEWYPRSGASRWANCCAVTCNQMAKLTVATLSKRQCCERCNEEKCSFSQEHMRTLIKFDVVAYGYMKKTTMNVLL